MKVAVIGTGYVGLVSGTGFAEFGNEVWCMDVDPKKIENLNEGILPIYEPGLDELVLKNHKAGRLHFTTNLNEAIDTAEIIFIAVGTPSDEDGRADLKYVEQVASNIGEAINSYKVIVTKSTVPVGTSKIVETKVKEQLEKRGQVVDFDVVSNPEFLKEGAAVEDFMRPDRVVVGVSSEKAKGIMERLYAPFVRNGHPVYFMDIASSEMTKYAANAMLATKISFMNEMARLCEKVGADVSEVRKGIGSDPRIGFHFIYPGLGYGGSCFPKDVKAIVRTGHENDLPMKIMNAVEEVNKEQRGFFIDKIRSRYPELTGKTVAIWGLAFKPGTDDMREAPSIDVINFLRKEGAFVKAYDPVATESAQKELGTDGIEYCKSSNDAIKGADFLILVTEWREFREPPFDLIKSVLKDPVVIDGRNQYNPKYMRNLGFEYYCIGRN